MIALILAAAALSVILHESGHVVAARLAGGRVLGIRVRLPKIAVVVDPAGIPAWTEMPIALAGPAADLLMVLAMVAASRIGLLTARDLVFVAAWPATSVLVNLLPIPGADGRHILAAAAGLMRRPAAVAARTESA